jgi:hypothetical protein
VGIRVGIGVDESVDEPGRHVDVVRTTPGVHRRDTRLRSVDTVSSTGARFLDTRRFGASRASSPVSTAAKTTDEYLEFLTDNDQSFLAGNLVDGACA